MKPQTVQIVGQGEATPYWFKVNPLYNQVVFAGKVQATDKRRSSEIFQTTFYSHQGN